jgi:hypothetical protein
MTPDKLKETKLRQRANGEVPSTLKPGTIMDTVRRASKVQLEFSAFKRKKQQ